MDAAQQKIDDLILKLRNLHVLLEESVLRGSHGTTSGILSEMTLVADEIAKLRETPNT